ncbi:hypothetical protein SB49_07310 [Sediminicola sp. YIK13]|uniref:hypothetical protein n=1 Tax=Sediminicola sp. YIK13 TaxID=1453352 RepID=UPI00072182D1|nr:hypothetical protein [Sediminicola sp. YIK13]ALM07634.1 hypothetical protein SB49_07310 [Sediminicola sp. YIK13]
MKTQYLLLCALALCILSSFNINKACDYASSNIGYIKSQTEMAIKAENINKSRYYAYKALSAIDKSKKQFENCDCEYATKSMDETTANLKNATRASTMASTRILLGKAIQNAIGSLDALSEHELHKSKYASDVLAMNTKETEQEKITMRLPEQSILHDKIDKSLLSYEKSLTKVVNSLECDEAYDYAINVFENCEKQLLRTDMTEAKMYYNLKTKSITEKALKKLEACRNNSK